MIQFELIASQIIYDAEHNLDPPEFQFMLYPLKIVDIELTRPIPTLEGLDGYYGLKAILRLHGVPIGEITTNIEAGHCSASSLTKQILDHHHWTILTHHLRNALKAGMPSEGLTLENLFHTPAPVEPLETYPLLTVVVCTRDRTTDLDQCLKALLQLDYPNLDLLVVDNAPSSDATQLLLSRQYPQIRYTCEPRPGLDWARNRGIIEAQGEIIAYTDDDVIVDPQWATAIAQEFVEHPEVMALTGLVVPYELETESQVLFEKYGGFGKGYDRKEYRLDPKHQAKVVKLYGCAGQCGTGANMAYRRSLFDRIGPFDPGLDVGTVTNGGGDIEMFFRLIKEGYTLVYQPKAMVRHRHRRDYTKLQSQLANNGVGLYAFWVRSAQHYPQERLAFLKLGLWWLWWWLLRRLVLSYVHPSRFPRDLIWGEVRGAFSGLTRYQQASRIVAEIEQRFGPTELTKQHKNPIAYQPRPQREGAVAVRTLELSEPLQPLTDVAEYETVRLFVQWNNWPVASLVIPNPHRFISKSRLVELLVAHLGLMLIQPSDSLSQDLRWNSAIAALWQHYAPATPPKPERLPAEVPVSIIVGTCDRPDDLRNCLHHLTRLDSPRRVEIVVVDNRPHSGMTPPVVAEFPGVVLVKEPRAGVSYARNAGINASTGDIIVTIDDDVTAPPDWLEKLVAPFVRSDVMCVTGNILPIELETESQRFFEIYGGLGRGYDGFEVNGDWFESFDRHAVPTWWLGGTANSAYRASAFCHPEIGLMDEALGPGMPSGVGEDTYLFYKVLKAGYTLRYQADAYVWHRHRNSMEALRRQLYNYSKGGPSYHLTTWLKDGDWRGLGRVLLEIPGLFFWRIKARIRRWNDYPWSLLWLEFQGNLAGPWSLWQSHLRVQREGRSDPYIPVSHRAGQSVLENSKSIG